MPTLEKMDRGETLPLPLPLCCSLHVQVAGAVGSTPMRAKYIPMSWKPVWASFEQCPHVGFPVHFFTGTGTCKFVMIHS